MTTDFSTNGSSPKKAELLDVVRSVLTELDGKVAAMTVAKLRHLVKHRSPSTWNRPGFRKRIARIILESLDGTGFEILDCDVVNVSRYGVELLFDSERDKFPCVQAPEDWRKLGIKTFELKKLTIDGACVVVIQGYDRNQQKACLRSLLNDEVMLDREGKGVVASPSLTGGIDATLGLGEVYFLLEESSNDMAANWMIQRSDSAMHEIKRRGYTGSVWSEYRIEDQRVQCVFSTGGLVVSKTRQPELFRAISSCGNQNRLDLTNYQRFQIWIPRCAKEHNA